MEYGMVKIVEFVNFLEWNGSPLLLGYICISTALGDTLLGLELCSFPLAVENVHGIDPAIDERFLATFAKGVDTLFNWP
jgi:hypothetical protein